MNSLILVDREQLRKQIKFKERKKEFTAEALKQIVAEICLEASGNVPDIASPYYMADSALEDALKRTLEDKLISYFEQL